MGSIGVDWKVLLTQIINCALFVLPFVLIGLIIWLIIRHQRTRTPIDIARDRYAQGKITLEEFDQIKRELSKE